MFIGRVNTGNSVMIGNRSVVPINTMLPDDSLLGVLSVPPETTKIPPSSDNPDYVLSPETIAPTPTAQSKYVPPPPHVTWVGNPPYQLHHVTNDKYPVPTAGQLAGRWTWDIIAILIPVVLFFIFTQIWWISYHFLRVNFNQYLPETIWSCVVMVIFRPIIPFIVAKILYVYLANGLTPRSEEYWSPFNHRWHIYSKTWAFFCSSVLGEITSGNNFHELFLYLDNQYENWRKFVYCTL